MSAGVARHTHADDAQPYDFKPWDRDQAIADGPWIKAYIAETARENGIDRHIRFHHKVLDANWSSADWQWVVRVHRSDTGEEIVLRASWLFAAAGYYRYDKGFTPAFEGAQRFHGPIVHPQHWPQDLDYRDKRVVVIGSGATAVTLVPALAARAAHVTLLQRTPSYVLPVPAADPVARRLRPWLGDRLTHAATRRGASTSPGSAGCAPCSSAIRHGLANSSDPSMCACCRWTIRWTCISIHLMRRGSSGCVRCRGATCSRRSGTAMPRWSPTTSLRSPRPASS